MSRYIIRSVPSWRGQSSDLCNLFFCSKAINCDVTNVAFDVIRCVFPPFLPAAMSALSIYKRHQLKKKDLYCFTPGHINKCGSINLVCFDKVSEITLISLLLK